ncbi:MAG: autotransporter domain-containing protein [Akkermansia sp.]|nr:autotransporter domain-containing protein [Akkermansia sp.]
MKTHLPARLRKALIAAIFAVSAATYNAQATEYSSNTTEEYISTEDSITIKNGVKVTTTEGGVSANGGISVGQYATLNSQGSIESRYSGSVTVGTGAQVTVKTGTITAADEFRALDHTTLTLKDGGITAKGITISDYSTATVQGHLQSSNGLTISKKTDLTVKGEGGHITVTGGNMSIAERSHVSVANGNVTVSDGTLSVSSTATSEDPHLQVANGNITAMGVEVTNAIVTTDGKLIAGKKGITIKDNADVSAKESISAEGDVVVTGGSTLTTEGSLTSIEHSVTITDTPDLRSTVEADSVEAKDFISIVNGDLTADTLVQAGKSLNVTNSSIKGTADIIALGGEDGEEHKDDPKDITIVDSTVEGASLTSVKGDITIKTTDETLEALEKNPELITSAVELTGDMTAKQGSITITKADVSVTGDVIADKGLTVEGIELEGDEEVVGNTLQTGDIIVENKVAQADTQKSIHDIIVGAGTSEQKQNSIKNAVETTKNHLKGVELTNIAEGSSVGEVVSVGDITIKGSTLEISSLTADTTEMGAAILDSARTGSFGEKFERELASKLPAAKITVTDSKLTVTGDVTSETTLEVTKSDFDSGNIIADAGVTIKGEEKIVEDSEKKDNRNIINTGDITVENTIALTRAQDYIAEIGAKTKDTEAKPPFTRDDAVETLKNESEKLKDMFGGVSIENVKKSTVGAVSTNGDITITGSKLTADSLKADAASVRETLGSAITEAIDAEAAKELADVLPTVSITVTDSDVKVKGEVSSDTEITVTDGSLLAKGDVTALDGDITATNADLASAAMTAEHGAITVEKGSLNATGDVTADAGLTVTGDTEKGSTLTAGAITVENKDAIAATTNTITEVVDKIGTKVDEKTFTKEDAIAELQEGSLDLAGVSITDMAEGSVVGDVSTNGNIQIQGSTMQAASLKADSTEARETIINTIAESKLGSEAVEELENLQPAKASIGVKESDVSVTGEVYSETGITVEGGETGASLLAEGTVTAADGDITAINADLASGDMIAEHGAVTVESGSLDATGDVVADAGLTVIGNEEGTSSLNAASITVENNDAITAMQDHIIENKGDKAALQKAIDEMEISGVTVVGVAEGTVGDVDAAGDISIADTTLTVGSLTADASALREAITSTIADEFSAAIAEQMADLLPVAKIEVTESVLTVEGDVTSESTIEVTDSKLTVTGDVAADSAIEVADSTLAVEGDVTSGSTIETTDSKLTVTGDVAADETITVNGGKLIAEGTVYAPEEVTVNAATLQAQTIEAETLVVNDDSKVKVEDTIMADIAGNGGTITSTGTDGYGLTIIGNVESTGVAIRTPQGGNIVIGDVTDTIPGVGSITGKQNQLTVKGDGNIAVLEDITGAENTLKVTGDGSILVAGAIVGDDNTLTTKGEGDIHIGSIIASSGNTLTAANGDITIDKLAEENTKLTVTSKKGGVTVTDDSISMLADSAITAKEDITIGDAEKDSFLHLALVDGTTVTSSEGDITLNQNIAAAGEGTAIEATEGKVTFTTFGNALSNGATVTAGDTIELAEGSRLVLGAKTADALQGKLSGTGRISAGEDDLNLSYDDTAFNGRIDMSGEHTLTISDKGVGADTFIMLNEGADLNETSTGASLGYVGAHEGSEVSINAGTIDGTTTASALGMAENSTLHIDASATAADCITVTKGISMTHDRTVHVTAQKSLESVEGDVRHTIIKLADGAVNEGVSEEVKYDLVGGQRSLQGKNMALVNAGDHVDLVISTNFRGTENAKPNQKAVNGTLKALSAEVNHNPGVLAEADSDLAHILDALDNTRSEGATLGALQHLSAAGNLVVTNMMMDTTRNHLGTLRTHMGLPTCKDTVKGGNAWAAYTGGHDFIGGDEYTGDYTRTHQGVIIGTDYSVNCNASLGLSLGYGRSIGHMDRTRAQADTMFADLYATVKKGALTHRFSAGVAMHDIDVKRHVQIDAAAHSYTGNSTGSMDAISWNLGYELSYDVKLGTASTLTPFATVDVAIHQMDTLREKGQGDASVVTDYDEPVQVDVALGAAYTRTFATTSAALTVSAAIHGELSETRPEADNHFVGGGRTWKTQSTERQPIYGELGASVVLPVSTSASLIGGGNFEFSKERISVGGNIGVNVKF